MDLGGRIGRWTRNRPSSSTDAAMATGADCMVSGAQDGVGRVRHRANAGSRPARLPECSRSTSSRTSPPSTPSPNRSGSRTGSSPPSPCEAEAPRLRNLSDFVLREVGCHWVAEGAAPAAATALERELTLPGVSQTVILTRTSTRSSPMPEGEELAALARSGATLAIHLSIRSIGAVCEALAPAYGADCPAAVVHRASWPRRAHRHRHPRRPRGEGAPPPPPAHRPHPRRPRPHPRLVQRQRPLQRRPPPPPPPPQEAPGNGLSRGGNRAAREPERGKPTPASQPQGANSHLIASQAPRRMRSNANGGRGIGEHHNP